MTPAIYQHFIRVQPEDLDELNHVNNVVYLKWVQDASAAHWNSLATEAIKEKFFWVVLRHEIDYRSPALQQDEILAKTWVHDFNGPRSTRIVQLLRKHDNRLLAEARTTWCLLSAQDNRPVRIGGEIADIFLKA